MERKKGDKKPSWLEDKRKTESGWPQSRVGHNSFTKWKVRIIWVGRVEGVKDRGG